MFKTKKINWMILACFMSLSMVLSACSQAQSTATNEPVSPQGTGDGLDMRDVRSQDEQNEELLESLLEDGTYIDERTYRYHSGTETISVRVSVENDVVTDISIESVGSTHPTSQNFINGVNAGLPELTIGKRIDQIELPPRISGSSLTTASVQEFFDELSGRTI